MHNQHAGLSQALADQRITDRHEQATMPDWHAALARRAAAGNGQPPAGGSWHGGQAAPPTSQSIAPVD